MAVMFTSKDHGYFFPPLDIASWENPSSQTPLGASSIPSNEALGQDSRGSSQGKHLEVSSLVKAPGSVQSMPGTEGPGDMCQ